MVKETVERHYVSKFTCCTLKQHCRLTYSKPVCTTLNHRIYLQVIGILFFLMMSTIPLIDQHILVFFVLMMSIIPLIGQHILVLFFLMMSTIPLIGQHISRTVSPI
uniref:Uncharacterized protein n=1 Tax=Cacopsylla melanoneura TaxID=428564 RepID=A0A8D8UCH7_9HEMI